MSMHTIRVTYDPTTRRISLVGKDNYGGATLDDNSVNIVVTGIVPDDPKFEARIDFGVQAKVRNHIYNHPFVLLEQNGDEWSCVIPNAILRAAGQARCRLPIQLVTLVEKGYVINSRNTIMLEVTQAIDGESDGNEIPAYDVPEWIIPENQTVYSEDVYTVNVTYTPATREIKVDDENSKYGGATIDCNSVRLLVTGITPPQDADDFSVRADFAMPVKTAEGMFVRPFTVLEEVTEGTWSCMIPQPVLMAAKEQKKLPFQLVMRHGDTVINTRNAITLEITRAINAMESIQEAYSPYIMYRNDTWEWIEDFTYDKGAVVVYNGEMYTSLTNDNLGNQPDENNDKWALLTGVESIVLNNVVGTREGTVIKFSEADLYDALGLEFDGPFEMELRDVSDNTNWPQDLDQEIL